MTPIDDVENLDLVMPSNNLLKYSLNYSNTASSLWFYSKDEATNLNNDIVNANKFKSFRCKIKLVGETVAQPAPNNNDRTLKNEAIEVPLKYLRNFWI